MVAPAAAICAVLLAHTIGSYGMIRILSGILLSIFALATIAGSNDALAHPHVWVTVKSELVYAPDGTVTAVRHHWTFDEMFSTFATQGLDTNKDGKLSREELQGLAEVNVTSLKEFEYFTFANGDGNKTAFNDAADYWLEHQNGLLTLHFTLTPKTPLKAKTLQVDIYDNSYFVDFSLAKGEAAKLVSAPTQCKLATAGPNAAAAPSQAPNEAFFNSLDPSSNWGARFASKIVVTCP
jgi:ABC-type uncharacterized transport system substrate-binding protein